MIEEVLVEKIKEQKLSYDIVYKNTLEYFDGDELAATTWMNKYAMKNKDGEFIEETPDDMHIRMSKEFSRIENKYKQNLNGESKSLSEYGQKREQLTEEKIYEYFKNFKYIIPQGSVMSCLGNPYIVGSLSNCIVLPKIHDSYGGICYADQQLTHLYKRRCGAGIDISTLRPKDTNVSNAAKTTNGAVSFMERFSNTTREVAQNGRRGALMITISVNHPDIEDFITIKQDLKKVTGANISVRLTDEFMLAVQEDKDFILKFPVDSDNPKITKIVKARKLWNTIIQCAWKTAEPGLMFWDNHINHSTSSQYPNYKDITSNPCLTKDTWIMTNDGPKQIEELILKPFIAMINGKEYYSTNKGFFLTGNKQVYELTTKKGFKIKATNNHKFKRTTIINEFQWTQLKDLKIGEKLKLNNNRNIEWSGSGNRDEGWLIGSLLGDGTFTDRTAILTYWGESKFNMRNKAVKYIKENFNYRKGFFSCGNEDNVMSKTKDRISINSVELKNLASKFGIKRNNKYIDDRIEKTSSEFYKGFLSGWFDADGTVTGNHQKGISVRLSNTSVTNLEVAQRMLARLGIISTIYKERQKEGYKKLPDGKGGLKEYFCKSNHDLVISNNNLKEFRDLINFREEEKCVKLEKLIVNYKRNLNKEEFLDEIVSIKKIGKEDVYDCEIIEAHEFDANGFSVHNCSEIIMSNDSCRLVALNMFNCIKNPFTKESKFDFKKWYEISYEGQRLMDDLVDLELEAIIRIRSKINSDPEPDNIKEIEMETWKQLYDSGKNGRRTGLGFTGLADTLASLGLKYDSKESFEIVEKIMKTKCEGEFDSSIDMSIERGKFYGWDENIEKESGFNKMLKKELPDLYERMLKCGRRNVSISTVAPTGTVSMMTQTSSGIEPVFMLSYKRRRKINPSENRSRVDFTDDLGDKWQEFNVYHPKLKMWMDKTGETNIKKSPYFNCTANDIDWIKRVELQSIIQKYVTHSISSTINVPKDISKEKIGEIYMESWKRKLKGITVYRDGCRSGVLISKEDKKENNKINKTHAPKRPNELECDVHNVTALGKKWLVLVGLLNNQPYEVFGLKLKKIHLPSTINKGKLIKIKKGLYNLELDNGFILEDLTSHFDKDEHETLTRMISTSLRHGCDIKFIVEQLDKSEGTIVSFGKAIARTLRKYISDSTIEKLEEKCPSCEQENTLIRQEGCVSCSSCGYQRCS